jgi:hypothetical protein
MKKLKYCQELSLKDKINGELGAKRWCFTGIPRAGYSFLSG